MPSVLLGKILQTKTKRPQSIVTLIYLLGFLAVIRESSLVSPTYDLPLSLPYPMSDPTADKNILPQIEKALFLFEKPQSYKIRATSAQHKSTNFARNFSVSKLSYVMHILYFGN